MYQKNMQGKTGAAHVKINVCSLSCFVDCVGYKQLNVRLISSCVNLVSIKFCLDLHADYTKYNSRQILPSSVLLQSRPKDTIIAVAIKVDQRLESTCKLYIENCRVKSSEFSEKFAVEFSMFWTSHFISSAFHLAYSR